MGPGANQLDLFNVKNVCEKREKMEMLKSPTFQPWEYLMSYTSGQYYLQFPGVIG